MYRFLAKPRWILFHILVIVLIIVMINLAFWQLRRLHEKKEFNADVIAKTEAPAAPLPTVVPADHALDAAGDVEWRSVTATGTYDLSGQVLIRNRSFDGNAGYHVVTPLVMADGRALLVNRGRVPLTGTTGTAPDVPPPTTGEVTVTGRVRPTQTRSGLGPRDPADGTLPELARVDIARLQQQVPYRLWPVYVEMTAQTPAPTAQLPVLVPLPELDEGPHLGYAVQWCIFSACAVVGWVLVVRKSAKARRQADAAARATPIEHPAPV